MADAKRYFIYARKSTDVEDKQVRSIDAQLSELHEFAQRNGINVTDVIIEKESAKTPGKRTEFNSMLNRIERAEAEGILSWHPDRLARNMTDGGRVIDLIDTGKIEALRFPTFWFDTTPQGKFMLSMAFSQSKYYVDSLSENTKRGIREKVRRGEYPSAAPIGYLNDKRTKRIALDRERAPLVKQAFERYATGNETLDGIGAFFAKNGVHSKNGKALIKLTVSGMLKNPIYYGQFRYAGEVSDGVHEPIISKALFDSVQKVLDGRFRYTTKEKRRAPKPLTGLLRCGECGAMITAETQKGHVYYRCTKKNKSVRCTQPYVREESLDAEVSRLLLPHGLRSDWAAEMLGQLDTEERLARQTWASLVFRKRQQLEAIAAKMGRLLEMRIDGEIDAKSCSERRAKLMGQKKTLEEEVSEIEQGRQPWLEPLRNWISEATNLRIITETDSLSDKRDLAKKVFGSNLFLTRKKARGEAVKPWAFLADNTYNLTSVRLLDAARTFYQENRGG